MSLLRTVSREYLNLTAEAAEAEMTKALKLLTLSPSFKSEEDRKNFESEMNLFNKLFKRFMQNRKSEIDWNRIKPPSSETIIRYSEIDRCTPDNVKALAPKLAVLKLNGGLGTTMGCVGPKSIIEVRSGDNFLDMTVKQIKYLNKEFGSDVPLVLMNSFNTHEDTSNVIKKYGSSNVQILTFNQSRYPRIYKESLQQVPRSPDSPNAEWYPPGHGDIYESLYRSGVLSQLMKQGIEYVFISNIDNLGATVDFNILQHMEQTKAEFIMEVTDKTRSDVKGGTLIEYEGNPFLLEIAQVPSQHVQEFKSIKKFKIFNTNNLWVKLDAIKRVVENDELDVVPIIQNNKDYDGKPVIQLETAAGAAISQFKKSHGINVPRKRFLPVKSTSDLFVIQSDIYQTQNGKLQSNPERPFNGPPVIKLGKEFKKVNDYLARTNGIPNILELDQLTIAGDVVIGGDVTLKGTVIIVANHGSHIDIPDGSMLENKVVTGNLRILDH